MTAERIAEIKKWVDRMRVHARRAVSLSKKMNEGDVHQENDLFWALVKYMENVQESAKQLDDINESTFRSLEEFPMETESDDLNWKGLKGMRDRLAHRFWDIDTSIIWKTAMDDFPLLLSLLAKLHVMPTALNIGAASSTGIVIDSNAFLDLPPVDRGGEPQLRNTIVCLFFDQDGNAKCVRIAKHSDTEMLIRMEPGLQVKRITEVKPTTPLDN